MIFNSILLALFVIGIVHKAWNALKAYKRYNKGSIRNLYIENHLLWILLFVYLTLEYTNKVFGRDI